MQHAAATTSRSFADLDWLNTALMVAAAAAAWIAPLELFALAYVVLGPLHYLTQISWLHDRRYFVERRTWMLVLIVPAALVVFGSGLDTFLRFDWRSGLIVGMVLGAVALAFTARPAVRWTLVAGAFAVAALSAGHPGVALAALFVPTVIHVFVFTGAFLLTGTLKRRSRAGLVSVAVYCSLAVVLLAFRPDASGYLGTSWATTAVEPFDAIRDALARTLGIAVRHDDLVGVTRFLAWAYTYHYLNWFSKTRLLRWHDVGRARLAGLAVAWAACLALYAVDYAFGFLVVGFVGMVHVVTELPLDVRVLVGVPSQARAWLTAPETDQ